MTRRGVDEAAAGFQALRRLPQTLAMLEAAARKVSTEAPRQERQWFQLPAFWIGLLGGAVIMLVLTGRPATPSPQPAPVQVQAAPTPTPAAPTPAPLGPPTTNPVTGTAIPSEEPPSDEHALEKSATP
jgi:hypothetical protein